MDRFIDHGTLSTISANSSAARVFMVYATQQAKRSIPGIGGNTRVITMTNDGMQYMKSWSVHEIQDFFGRIDSRIRMGVGSLTQVTAGENDPIERFLQFVSKGAIEDYRQLKKELERIEADDTLV